MKKKVWLCRDDDDDDTNRGAIYRLHLLEPEWVLAGTYRGHWRSSGQSIFICIEEAKSFLGKDALSSGQCVEVNCALGTVWEK